MTLGRIPGPADRGFRSRMRSPVLLFSLTAIFSLILVSTRHSPHLQRSPVASNDLTGPEVVGKDTRGETPSHWGWVPKLSIHENSTTVTPLAHRKLLSSKRTRASALNFTTAALTTRPTITTTAKTTTTEAIWFPDADSSLNCSALLLGDKEEQLRAHMMLDSGVGSPPGDDYFLEVTSNCAAFRQKRGYPSAPFSSQEAEFPLAYSMRMHKNVPQAEKLLRAIYSPQNVYCIHIDSNSPPLVHKAMAAIADCLPNVFISSVSLNYIYSGFSPVEADLMCMQELLGTGVQWKYYMNLAGTEFPLKTNRQIVELLRFFNGTNDVEQIFYPRNLRYRFERRYATLKLSRKQMRTRTEKEPFRDPNVAMMKGSSYNTYSRKFVEWILKDALAQELIEWSRDISCPDELVWATLNHIPGAPGGYPVEVSHMRKHVLSREVIWRWDAAYCFGEYVHEVCILSYGDLKWLSRRWELFANKFDLDHDYVVLDCLEEMLQNRTKNPDPDHSINWTRIYKMAHVKYAQKKGG